VYLSLPSASSSAGGATESSVLLCSPWTQYLFETESLWQDPARGAGRGNEGRLKSPRATEGRGQ